MKSGTVRFSPLAPSVRASPKSNAFPTSALTTIWGLYSINVSPTEPCTDFDRPKEQELLHLWNTNGKFKGFRFVWEAAMCQHAALSIKVTSVCVCVCVHDFSASLLFRALKPTNLKANYGKIHSNIKVRCYSCAPMRKCLLETKGKVTLNVKSTTK